MLFIFFGIHTSALPYKKDKHNYLKGAEIFCENNEYKTLKSNKKGRYVVLPMCWRLCRLQAACYVWNLFLFCDMNCYIPASHCTKLALAISGKEREKFLSIKTLFVWGCSDTWGLLVICLMIVSFTWLLILLPTSFQASTWRFSALFSSCLLRYIHCTQASWFLIEAIKPLLKSLIYL